MGKSILITGCSSGIGLCTAEILHKRGYRVFATARKASDVLRLNAKGLESIHLDVDDSSSMHQALNQILEKTGGTLDALFNNAGFSIPCAVEDLTRELMRDQFETNVFGAIELTNLVLPIMRKQGYGRIIQNSSILGVVTTPCKGAYVASKFALEAFSNTLRLELRGTNIFVSIMGPGPINTPFRINSYKTYKSRVEKIQGVHADRTINIEKLVYEEAFNKIPFAQPAHAVVKKVILALESKKPKAHYYVGLPAQVISVLHRFLPDPLLDWVLTIRSAKQK